MVDVSMLTGAVASMKTAASIASDLVAVRDQAVLQGKVIELQRIILEAQSSALAAQGQMYDLLEQLRSLRAELAAASGWDSIAGRYQLEKFYDSMFVYELKADAANGEPIHKACPNCFQKKQISILQRWDEYKDKTEYVCLSCDKHMWLGQKFPRQPT